MGIKQQNIYRGNYVHFNLVLEGYNIKFKYYNWDVWISPGIIPDVES